MATYASGAAAVEDAGTAATPPATAATVASDRAARRRRTEDSLGWFPLSDNGGRREALRRRVGPRPSGHAELVALGIEHHHVTSASP